MTPLLRDIILFIAGVVGGHFLLIGPLFAFMIVTGGALFALPILAVLLFGALALDRFVIRPSGIAGWLLTAPILGLCVDVAFIVLTTETGDG